MANPLNNNQNNMVQKMIGLIDASKNPTEFIMSKLQGNQQMQGNFAQIKNMGNIDKNFVVNLFGRYGIAPAQVEMLAEKMGIK